MFPIDKTDAVEFSERLLPWYISTVPFVLLEKKRPVAEPLLLPVEKRTTSPIPVLPVLFEQVISKDTDHDVRVVSSPDHVRAAFLSFTVAELVKVSGVEEVRMLSAIATPVRASKVISVFFIVIEFGDFMQQAGYSSSRDGTLITVKLRR